MFIYDSNINFMISHQLKNKLMEDSLYIYTHWSTDFY
jgi:hypothetical protein